MSKELHGNTVVRQCLAIIDYADRSKHFVAVKLAGGVRFAVSEARKWLIEQNEKEITQIRFYRLPSFFEKSEN